MRSVCGAGISDCPPGAAQQRGAEARPEQPAVGLREDRLRELVALLLDPLGLERVQPDVDAVLHVADRGGEEPRPDGEHAHPDHHEREPVGGHVEQRQEAAEVHQRRAEVADEDEHEHRRAPDHEQRPEVLELRHGDRPQLAALDEHLARVAQVGRQEDDDRDLPELRRLEGDGPELDAEVGAVDLLADPGHARQQQQQQAGERDRVAVALEHAEVAQQQDRAREQDQPDDEPLGLLARQRVVDPVDHDEAEAGEHADQREDVGVGVREREAQEDVPGEAQQQEDQAVGQRDVRQLLGLLDEDRREAGGQQQRRRDQRHQLAVALAHESICPRSSWITRFSASSLERSL